MDESLKKNENETNLKEREDIFKKFHRRNSHSSDSSIYYDVEEEIILDETLKTDSIEVSNLLESEKRENLDVDSKTREEHSLLLIDEIEHLEQPIPCNNQQFPQNVHTVEPVPSISKPTGVPVISTKEKELLEVQLPKFSSEFLNSESRNSNSLNLTREEFMYNIVFPELNLFAIEKCFPILENVVAPLVKQDLIDCNKSLTEEYKMWKRVDTMDMRHMISVLSSCGKWHGSIMAFKDQRPNTFDDFSKKLYNIMQKYLTSDEVLKMITNNYEKMIYMLKGIGRSDLAEKYKRTAGVLGDILLGNNVKYPVIALHADFWVDNIMFKEQSGDNGHLQMYFSDFQLPMMDSPMRDLSYIIYCYGDQNLFEDFDFLMHAYYASVSETLLKLGSNPDQVFPYEKMKREWKKYGMFGALMMLIEIVDESDDEIKGGQEDEKNRLHKFYNKRIADIFIHYGENFL